MAQQFDHSMPYNYNQQLRFSILADEYAKLLTAGGLNQQGLSLLYQKLEVGDLSFELSRDQDKRRREERLAKVKEAIGERMGPGFVTGFLSIGSQVPDDPSSLFEPPPSDELNDA